MHKKCKVIVIVYLFALVGVSISLTTIPLTMNTSYEHSPEYVTTASMTNYNNINSIFDEKISDYATYGFFPQMYEPSLQATYYGLYILDAIGKLDRVNKTKMINYIMSNYNSSTHLFMDKYAYRYLDTDFSSAFLYPLTSILEVYCYAILSLEVLDALDLIDIAKSVDFIWSCYNPLTSGFIGQPYSSSLEYYAKISSMDNTYYAIKTLDILMSNWAGYAQERDELIQFINSLQVTDPSTWEFGGFMNDNTRYYYSLRMYVDTHIFASYYCIKSLEVFGMEDTINIENFYLFLEQLYVEDQNFFQYMSAGETNIIETVNIVSTALGLDLADITGFFSYNKSGTIDFVFNSRNSLGIWDGSTKIQYHELIDTFQIIRALKDCNQLSKLHYTDIIHIADSIAEYYLQHHSFSLISMDYTTLNLLSTIITSFELYGRLSELDLQELYLKINETYYLNEPLFNGFSAITPIERQGYDVFNFRSNPIEFHTIGNKNYFKDVEYFCSHQSTFYALHSLKTMFKLDDFALMQNLNTLVQDILNSQFLDTAYPEYYGAFTYMLPYGGPLPNSFLLKDIHFKYTYYAIKALEILTEYLNLGNLTSLDLNVTALQCYINTHTIETTDILYFDPHYSSNYEIILQNTYYMVYVLQALNIFTLDINKIKNLIEQNLDYSNIKNIYFSNKLAELLELDLEFDVEKVQLLVADIFSQELHEFFLTSQRLQIDQEIFLWICEMALLHNYEIIAHYLEEAFLGGYITINASLSNLILSYFDFDLSLIFESTQLGSYECERRGNNEFVLELHIPQDPNNFPNLNGTLYAMNGMVQLVELNISIITMYPQITIQYPLDAMIGSPIAINASYSNLDFSYGDHNLSFAFESIQLGEHDFERIDTSKYLLELNIPFDHNNYPNVSGIVYALNGEYILAEFHVVINTFYPDIYVLYQEEVMLGGYITFNTSLYNIDFSHFDDTLLVIFESAQLGYHEFERTDLNEFILNLHIPYEHNNYPDVEGRVYAINGEFLLAECNISFTTFYPEIIAQYEEEMMLGGYVSFEASLSDIVFTYFDENLSLSFESTQLGSHEFQRVANNEFILNLHIPEAPYNYPNTNGCIYAKGDDSLLAELNVSIITFYPEITVLYQEEVMLGAEITFEASCSEVLFSYLTRTDQDDTLSFTFLSEQLGYEQFERSEANKFFLTLSIPLTSNNYPNISGKVYAFNGEFILTEFNISIITYYPEKVYTEEITSATVLSILLISIPGGVVIFSGTQLRRRDPGSHI